MDRKRFTDLQRARIFDRAGGLCHLCGQKIHKKWDVEHILPLSMGGTNDAANLAPAHQECHGEKTRKETTARAKCDRIRAKHLGAKKSSAWQSKFKRKVNGTTVLRTAT